MFIKKVEPQISQINTDKNKVGRTLPPSPSYGETSRVSLDHEQIETKSYSELVLPKVRGSAGRLSLPKLIPLCANE